MTARPARIGVVINPISGKHGVRPDTGARRQALAEALAANAGVTIEVAIARARHHAIELSRAFVASGCDLVIAWGGDGTVNEVAGPLIGTSTALGVIPSGSGDGLARSLGLPREPRAAFARAISTAPAAIDVGYLADRHFLNVAGIGFDATVGLAFNRGKKRGLMRYVLRGLHLIWTYQAPPYRISLDETTLEGQRFLVAFANGREYGNRLILSSTASLQDGLLDAVIVLGGSALRQCWRARRLFWAPHLPAHGISRVQVTRASVTGDSLVCHVDGETFETRGTVDVRVEPGALLVRGAGEASA